MNWNEIESGWKSYTAKAREQWTQLTATQAKHQELASPVQKAAGVGKEESVAQAGKVAS